jgi:hypothetical protein
MIEPEPTKDWPIPEPWSIDYATFRARWDRAERWWPWFKRLHHVGTWLLKLSVFGCLLDLLFCGPDDWTAFKWLIVPGGILGGAICAVGHGIGEGVIRVQSRALNEWHVENNRHLQLLMRQECDTPVPGADVDEGKR